MRIIDYTLSDVFTLDPENRWVVKAKLVPWEKAEEKYAHMFHKNGRKAKDIRKALGALLIQQQLKCSDADVVEMISENPYLQHFVGMDKWSNEAPFDPSLMVWFRKRLSAKMISEINEEMCRRAAQPEGELDERKKLLLETTRKLYEQQAKMYSERSHCVENRIVSLSQPHICPIPRGKSNAKTEFGAKVAVSIVSGYMFSEHMSFDNFNEGILLETSIEGYKKKYGMLPLRILADTIYRNRHNRELCRKLNIKLSGLPLGRRNASKYRQQLKDFIADCSARNEVEGKIGIAKTRYGMGRIRAKLPETNKSSIVLSIMTMNLNKLAKAFLCRFLRIISFEPKLAATFP